MSIKDVKIDKTEHIQKLMQDYKAVALCGLPGIGRRTAVKIMVEKHPEIEIVHCTLTEFTDRSVFIDPECGKTVWYLIESPESAYCQDDNKKLQSCLNKIGADDRVILLAGGMLPEPILDLIWQGTAATVLADMFWFTESETWRFLKASGSHLRSSEVYYVTGGWAGCIAMLVRLEHQLKGKWTVRELCHRYEIQRYIRNRILNTFPEEEIRILEERISFPFLNEELETELWPDTDFELEEKLVVRGAIVYEPESQSWHVQPALRMAVKPYISAGLCEKAVKWYEKHGYIQEALECCWYLSDKDNYRKCLIRNYDKVPFLHYESPVRAGDTAAGAELLYLDWMQSLFKKNIARLDMIRRQIDEFTFSDIESERAKENEIFLNIAYTDPVITTPEWMSLLKEKTVPGHPVRLYFMLGESVSYLSGIRDLSDLFACSKGKKELYRSLWQERLAEENQIPFRLAEWEYDFQTYHSTPDQSEQFRIFLESLPDFSWQIQLVTLYLTCLFANEESLKERLDAFIRNLASVLMSREQNSCRWNARALFYFACARWGETENLISWVRETGGDISNNFGKTNFYMFAEAKINLYLGNFSYVEKLLQVMIPCFKRTRSSRWLAEALFQKALVEQEKGSAAAVKTVAEAITVANPYRYVRLFTSYGSSGVKLLENFRDWMNETDVAYHQHKKKYKYGNVLRMPMPDWIDYIIRRAKRQKKYFPDLRENSQNIYHVEKLTVTEQMVLHYIESGLSNADISEKMNIRLSTVKSHIYNIYRKLGVSTRMKAVQKAKESGLL